MVYAKPSGRLFVVYLGRCSAFGHAFASAYMAKQSGLQTYKYMHITRSKAALSTSGGDWIQTPSHPTLMSAKDADRIISSYLWAGAPPPGDPNVAPPHLEPM